MTLYYLNEIALTGIFDDIMHICFDVVLYWMVTRLWIKPIYDEVVLNEEDKKYFRDLIKKHDSERKNK